MPVYSASLMEGKGTGVHLNKETQEIPSAPVGCASRFPVGKDSRLSS